jgi:hypothetical protein
VPRERVAVLWGDAGDEASLQDAIDQIRNRLRPAALVEQPAHG